MIIDVQPKINNNIKQIYVLNSNFMFNTILNIVWPFLDDKIKDLIITVDKLPFETTF